MDISFGERLRISRLRMGYNQSQLAELVGLKGAAISKYEKGLASPNVETLTDLCKALSASADWLLNLSTEKGGVNVDFKINGLDELNERLDALTEKVSSLEGNHTLPFLELFSDAFMQECSSFSSFADFLEAGGFEVNSPDDFKAIPDDEFDAHIAETTDFDSWESMQKAAVAEYLKKQLGF